jgi:hypothetical protein
MRLNAIFTFGGLPLSRYNRGQRKGFSMPPVDRPNSNDELQFATAEPAAGGPAAMSAGQACLGCGRPIVGEYFALGDRLLCPSCCAQVQAPPVGSPFGRFVSAALMGLGAGLLGALVWFAVRRFAHLQIGLIAVLVGYMVGKAVRKGSGGRGGPGYQVLAVALTYACIAANYMPDIYQAIMENADKPNSPIVVAVSAFAFSLALPFLAGAKNIIGLLIIGFALWEAWKFTRRRVLPITGPYRIGAMPPMMMGGPPPFRGGPA